MRSPVAWIETAEVGERRVWQFNPAPGWPAPPPGWAPPAGWVPDPSWPPAPAGWSYWTWVPDPAPPTVAGSAPTAPTSTSSPPPTHDPSGVTMPAPGGLLDPPAAPPAPTTWRARHAAKKEAAQWQVEQGLLDRMDASAQAALATGGGIDGGLVLAADEATVWSGPAALIEPHRQPGHFVGGSSGVSFRVATGVRWRVGGMRGHYVPGPELQTPVDQGTVVVTTDRVVFTGSRATREWSFAKLLGVDASPDDKVALLHVSNRQKVSGLHFGTDGADFQSFLALAVAIHQHGAKIVADECASAATEHRAGR